MDVAMDTCLYVRPFVRFSPVYLRIARISTKLSTVIQHQIHVMLITLSSSLGQNSWSASDGHKNLVNPIAHEPLKAFEHRRRSYWTSGGTHGGTYYNSFAVEAKNTFCYIVMQVIWCLKFCNMTKSGRQSPRSKFWGRLVLPSPRDLRPRI